MCAHQPVAVAECHGGGFGQARHVSDVEAGPKQRLHARGAGLALPLHCSPWRHKAGIGPQPQVQVSAENCDIVEEAATRVLFTVSREVRRLDRDGSAGPNPLLGHRRRHHVGHQAALGVSAHRHRQDALRSVPQVLACNGEGR